MRLALIIDPLKTIDVRKDTSLALAYAAKELGCEVYFVEYNRLYFSGASVSAEAYCVERIDPRVQEVIALNTHSLSDCVVLSDPVVLTADDLDVVLMRKDPPVDTAYWATTHLLSLWELAGVLVANSTRVLREYNEKCAILQFPELTTETVVTADVTVMDYFLQRHEIVVVKPLDSMGGAGVERLRASDPGIQEKLLAVTQGQRLPVMMQKALDVESTGDKRILLFHGIPLPYVLLRRPAPGRFRANLAAGGSGEVVALSKDDKELADAVARGLPIEELGLIGLDVIDGCLTEINVTSPTCLRQIQQHAGENYARKYIQGLLSRG
jgi:glutathione synthase